MYDALYTPPRFEIKILMHVQLYMRFRVDICNTIDIANNENNFSCINKLHIEQTVESRTSL